jgi:hypothetical protein
MPILDEITEKWAARTKAHGGEGKPQAIRIPPGKEKALRAELKERTGAEAADQLEIMGIPVVFAGRKIEVE